jgi:hypothetical protein
MKTRTLWNQRLGMLMACASPGSALAYHLGQTNIEANLVRRTKDDEQSAAPPASASTARSTGDHASARTARDAGVSASGISGWLRRAFERYEIWSWQREMRERERYLAQAQNVYDLETRMRDLDSEIFFSRARTLR